MTSTVTFSSFDMSNNDEALTVEGVFQKYASFAGIHGLEFEDKIGSFDPAKWTPNGPNITVASNTITTTAAVAASIVWYADPLPHSYVIEFTAQLNNWSFIARGNGSDDWYKLDYNEAGYVSLFRSTIEGITVLCDKELAGQEIAAWGRVRIAVRDAQSSSDSPIRILYISLWVNDNLVISVADNNASSSELNMGLMINQNITSGQLIFSDIRVANLGEIITISSLDPGEKPIGAIQRAIEDRYIKFWMRWNGKLKVWKPKARSRSLIVARSKTFSLVKVEDIRQAITHIRVLGAFHWVQVVDDEMVRFFGHRFRELQNTSAWNADDCYQIGLEMLIRAKEQVYQARFDSFGLVLLELEDRIQVPNTGAGTTEYIIDNISCDYEAGTLRVSGSLRQYYYGEP